MECAILCARTINAFVVPGTAEWYAMVCPPTDEAQPLMNPVSFAAAAPSAGPVTVMTISLADPVCEGSEIGKKVVTQNIPAQTTVTARRLTLLRPRTGTSLMSRILLSMALGHADYHTDEVLLQSGL